jgi:hypothetical protein
VRLAIADPPYPPLRGAGGIKPRASRWYGDAQLAHDDRPADNHPDAAEWDDPARHRKLLEQLRDEFDGWAIATAPDGLQAYGELPLGTRIMAWVRTAPLPGSHRIMSTWEPVITYPPRARISSRSVGLNVRDVLIAGIPGNGFMGAKPREWTRWVLDALAYDPDTDELVDMFPGSGAVTNEAAQRTLL